MAPNEAEPELLHLQKEAGLPLGIELADGSDGWLSQILVRESHKGVLVSSVLPSSVASGILCERDTIISVNGVPTRTAKTTAGMLRAAGGTVTLRVVRHDPEELPPVQGESSFLSTVMTSVRRVPPALLSACVAGCILVAVVGWGYSSHASRAALRSAQSEAAKWRGKAMAERESLDAGRRHAAQLAQQEAELRTRIHALRRANQSLSGVAAETLAQLQQQRHNVSEQSRQWRASNRQAQQRLKQARAQVGDLQKQMETVRHDLGSALRTAKAEVTRLEAELNAARAAEHAERAKLARIRKRLRAHAAEMDSLAGGGVSASSEGFSAADAAAAGTSMAPVVPEAPRPDELIGDEHLVVSLNGVNMMFNSNPQARPRYFTLVTVPKADVMAWIASMAVFEGAKVAAGPNGNSTRCITRCFSEQWVTADGMHLLFARVGRFLDQYRTILLTMFPRSSAKKRRPSNSSEYRLSGMWRSSWHNKVVSSHTVSHNFGATFVPSADSTSVGTPGTLYAVGGQHWAHKFKMEKSNGWSRSHRLGVRLMHATSLHDVYYGHWFPFSHSDDITPSPILDGAHPGCVERRKGFDGICNFDGRLSLVRFQRRFMLFARSNIKSLGGGRHVQVSTSSSDDAHGPWGAFALLSIEGYDLNGPGNIYMATVKRSPWHRDLLIGLFAVNLGDAAEDAKATQSYHGHSTQEQPHNSSSGFLAGPGNTDGKSFIGLSVSCNGVAWSALQEIAPTTGLHGRTLDQPVDGLLTMGGRVSVLIQRNVYEIAPDAREKSRIVRREIRKDAFERLVVRVRSKLPGC